MGFLADIFGQNKIDAPSWQGPTTAPTTQKQTLNR